MLKRVSIENFKGFKDKIDIDLSNIGEYDFNSECIVNGIVNKSIVYGRNAAGKSNLALAIFDIVSNLTDNNFAEQEYENYLNCDSIEKEATFEYLFYINGEEVKYLYRKSDVRDIVSEELFIGANKVISFNKKEGDAFVCKLKGTENLLKEQKLKISRVKYIALNSALVDNKENSIFKQFIEFVNKMLYIKGLNYNTYIGFTTGTSAILSTIVQKGKLEEFEKFLNDLGVKCKLCEDEENGRKTISFLYKNGLKRKFTNIASTGTAALALHYFWFIELENISLLVIDEFDAFYHFELSEEIIEFLKKQRAQMILTTHNTSLITTEILRPDCYFIIKNNNSFKSFHQLSSFKLSEQHNLEKIFRANGFEE